MGTIEQFEDIEAWQNGRQLTRAIYRTSRRGAFGRDFALRDQTRRASISITSNISERFEPSNNNEFIRFLTYAKGSAGEVRSQLYVALDERYITQKQFDELFDFVTSTINQIGGLIAYLRRHAR